MKERKSIVAFMIFAVLVILGVLVWIISNNRGNYHNITNTTAINTENESIYETQELVIETGTEGDVIVSSDSQAESGQELLEESGFAYFYGMEDDEGLPKRFGYVVEEDIEKREVPLREEDFKQLKKGQYFYSSREKAATAIVDVVGWYDGQIMYTARVPGAGAADTSPYYKIDDNTYVILFFEFNYINLPLDHIEVWDTDGNKLRDIEID